MVGYRCSDRTSEGKDHHRCLPRTSISAQPGCSARIHQPRRILRSSHKLVALLPKGKKRSWMATGHPTYHLGIGRIILFDSTLFFGERAEAEMSELIKFHTVVKRYVIVKDLYQKPFLYPMIGDMFD
ncbi:hypothetical protein Tco_1438993 [Tanacetum coccineum]